MYPVGANKAQRFRLGQTASSPASISSLDFRQGDWSPQFWPFFYQSEPSLMGHSLLSPVRCSAIFRECHMNSYDGLHIHVADVHLPWWHPRQQGALTAAQSTHAGSCPAPARGFTSLKIMKMWVKQCHFYQPWLGKVRFVIFTTYWNGGLGGDWGMVYEIVLPTLWYIILYYDIFWLLSQSSPSGLSWIRNEKCLRPLFTKNSHSNLFRSSEMRYLLYGPIWTYIDLYAVQSVQFNGFFNFRRLRISQRSVSLGRSNKYRLTRSSTRPLMSCFRPRSTDSLTTK